MGSTIEDDQCTAITNGDPTWIDKAPGSLIWRASESEPPIKVAGKNRDLIEFVIENLPDNLPSSLLDYRKVTIKLIRHEQKVTPSVGRVILRIGISSTLLFGKPELVWNFWDFY
jgi:hypothetical protein